MEHLHAYWRMEYIEAPKPAGQTNPFAALPSLGDDRAALIIHRGTTCFAVLNRFPYNAGHLLILPYREVPDLEDLTAEERNELMALIVFSKRVLSAAIKPDGFNVGFNLGTAAGAGIPKHLHAHIVPRWTGDTNFMPVVGQTRVLPQALASMYDRLQPIAAALAAAANPSA
jgi:ATP adenylyltransferase